MGKKVKLICLAIITSLLYCTPAFAMTADDLYKKCNVELPERDDADDLNIILNYNYAKRYVAMYRYIAESEYDISLIESRIEKLQKRKIEIENELKNGYSLSLNNIYSLEDEYKDVNRRLNDAMQTMVSSTVENFKETPADVPTYEEYVEAMSRRRISETQNDLGSSDRLSVLQSVYVIDSFDDKTLTYAVVPKSVVTALFNGKVTYVSDDVITINHYNGIMSSIRGVHPNVKVGDTVYQGQYIGDSESRISVRLRLNGTYVDVYKLLEVEDENI